MVGELWLLEGAQAGGDAGGKNGGPSTVEPWEMAVWSGREVCGMRCVAGKGRDIAQTADGEGTNPAPN